MTNKTEYQKLYEDRLDAIKRIEKQIELLNKLPINLVKQAFPQGYWSNSWSTTFDFELPMSFPLIADFKEFCSVQGWEIYSERQYVWDDSGNAGHFFSVSVDPSYKYSIYFEVSFRSGKEGATCVLKEIGKKEVPVYEVVCLEGAKEDTWNQD